MRAISSSVILCTRNRISDVKNFLHSLVIQTEFPDELIIVDSSDQPINKTEMFEKIFNEQFFSATQLKYIHSSPGLTYQRNIGISLATKEIIYFFDDDTILEPDYVQHMNKIFAEHPEFAGGMGTVSNTPPKQDNIY